MLITLEGLDGSGKTSQIKAISEYLKSINRDTLVTREPGGTIIGAKIRSILLNPDHKEISSLTELLLYGADRAQHLEQVVRPALKEGKIVISDRFVDSNIVYQGLVLEKNMKLIQQINDIILDGLLPDITFLLDIDPNIGLIRANRQLSNGNRDISESRFEQRSLVFHEKIRVCFLKQALIESKRFVIIDASKPMDKVTFSIINEIDKKLNKSQ